MTHPLDSTYLKVERAQEHLKALDGEVEAFLDSNPFHMFRERNPRNGHYIFSGHWSKQPSGRLGLLLGDWANNLRSSLDHLSWQLALLSTDEPSTDCTFPIFERLNIGRFNQRVRLWPEQARLIAETLQPYKGNERAKQHFLWVLNHLANTDKHSAIRIVPARVLIPGLRPGKLMVIKNTFEDDLEIHVPVQGATEPELNPVINVEIAMPAVAPGATLPFAVLADMQRRVRDEVIAAFAQFFAERHGN